MKIDVVVPVYNEAHVLREKISQLHAFLEGNCHEEWKIVIADNGSTDGTTGVMQEVVGTIQRVEGVHLDEKGRGGALKHAWLHSRSDAACYVDVDLSTDLSAIPEMIDAFGNGADLVVGSRLKKGAEIKRRLHREVLSRGYNAFHKLIMQSRFSDAQCGFKGITIRAASVLLPLTKNTLWFFDTELLLLSQYLGYKIVELPVKWVEDTDSRVRIRDAVMEDIKGITRMRWTLWFDKRLRNHVVKETGIDGSP